MADRVGYTQPQTGNQGFARTMKTLGGAVALLVTDPVATNTVQVMLVPKGFVCTGVYFASTDIDTNGSPTVTMALGDAASPARLVAAATIGQTGTSTTTLAATGLYYEFLQDTPIVVTFPVGSATAVAGVVTTHLTGFMK